MTPPSAGVKESALLRLYAVCLTVAAAILLLWLIEAGRFTIGDPPTVVGLAFVALLVERRSVMISEHLEISISALPILFAALALGPGAAVIVSASALVLDCRPPFTRWVIWTTSKASVAGVAGLIAASILSQGHASLLMLFVAALAISAFEAYADLCVNAGTVSLRKTGNF
ncbi:MAG: hypothetical protein ACXVRA_06180, partial [Gaiellaceae bacterium]